MTPLSEPVFRSLLADCSPSAFADFVADLWRARGREVRREGDRLVVGDRELRPVLEADEPPPEGTVLVTATPTDADESVGPAELYHALLYDVPRERAAELFEAHFDRPLAIDRSDETETPSSDETETPSSDEASEREPEPTTDEPSEGLPESGTGDTEEQPPESGTDDTEKQSDPDDASTASPEGAGEGATEDSSDESTPPGMVSLAKRAADGLPRDRSEFGALLANPRVLVVLLAVVLILSASLWGLFLYQPDAETEEAPFAVTDRPAPADGSYRIVAEMDYASEGERSYVASSRTYAPGDPAVAVSRFTYGRVDDQETIVRYERGNVSYERRTWTDESRYEEIRKRASDARDVVRTSNSTGSIYWIHRDDDDVSAEPNLHPPTLTLSVLPYERTGTTTYEGREVVRYEPTTGWTMSGSGGRGASRLRVRSASGELLVDAETGALLYADVEATVVKADTWADVFTAPAQEVSIQYRVETDVNRPRAPPWVEGLAETANATVG